MGSYFTSAKPGFLEKHNSWLKKPGDQNNLESENPPQRSEKGKGGVDFIVHLSDEQLSRVIEDRFDEMLERISDKVFKICKLRYQEEEKRLKQAYTYDEIVEIFGLTKRTIRERVRNPNMWLKAEGRNTQTPFILKDVLYTHFIKDMDMDPKEAFEQVY